MPFASPTEALGTHLQPYAMVREVLFVRNRATFFAVMILFSRSPNPRRLELMSKVMSDADQHFRAR